MSWMMLEDISAGYNGTPVLKGLSLNIRAGEVLALIGPNGVGKTTLIRVICRVIRPDSGRVELNGHEIWSMSARRFARAVARVSQSERLTWSFTIRQVVGMGRFAHRGWLSAYNREDHEAIDHAIRAAGLWEHRERSIHAVSGGETQRAIVARAIHQQPAMLVLDEPVAHLDVKHRIGVLDTVKELAASGTAVVLSLHDLNMSALYADRIALMADGRISTLGTPEQVLTRDNLESAYGTRMMVGRYPGIDRLLVTPLPSWLDDGAADKEPP